jgi:hypothetical protein
MSSTQSPLGPPSLPDTFPADLPLDQERAPVAGCYEHTHLIEAGRGAPPRELLAEMARADEVRSLLAATGQVVRFHAGDGAGPLRIELCELDGTPVRALSAGEAIALAAPESE